MRSRIHEIFTCLFYFIFYDAFVLSACFCESHPQ